MLGFGDRTIFVSKGLVQCIGSDAGVAYVLAHELSHVLATHATQQIASQLFTRIGQLLLLSLVDVTVRGDKSSGVNRDRQDEHDFLTDNEQYASTFRVF